MTALLAMGAAIAGGVWYFKYQAQQAQVAQVNKAHATKESAIDLNDAQLKTVPALAETDRTRVYRVKGGTNGVYQTLIATPDTKTDPTATALGSLHRNSVAGEVEVPIYLCEYGQKDSGNTVLESNATCPGGGRLAGASAGRTPVGFLSKNIQTGYLLLSRCSSASGMYNSLNPRCENPADFWESNLGAIRAAQID